MGLSNAKIERISELITRRIEKRIDSIMRDNADEVDRIQATVRAQTEDELGVALEFEKIASHEGEANKLRKRANVFDDKVGELKKVIYGVIFPDRDISEAFHYQNKHDVERRISVRKSIIENAAFNDHTELSEVARLRGELERIEESLWIATSEKHIREIMAGLNELLGDEPTQLETVAQNSTPPNNPS